MGLIIKHSEEISTRVQLSRINQTGVGDGQELDMKIHTGGPPTEANVHTFLNCSYGQTENVFGDNLFR